jgi:hypothetical protein
MPASERGMGMSGKTSRSIALGLFVVLALGAGASSAFASREIGVFPGRTIESAWTLFTITEPGGLNIRCETRVKGVMVFFENIRKVVGATAGEVEDFRSQNCRSSLGEAAVVEALVGPEAGAVWLMRYQSFSGRLPEMTEILFLWQIRFLIGMELWVGCLFEGTIGVGTSGTTMTEYRIEEFRFLREYVVPLIGALRRGIMECPQWVTLRASFRGERIAAVTRLIR